MLEEGGGMRHVPQDAQLAEDKQRVFDLLKAADPSKPVDSLLIPSQWRRDLNFLVNEAAHAYPGSYANLIPSDMREQLAKQLDDVVVASHETGVNGEPVVGGPKYSAAWDAVPGIITATTEWRNAVALGNAGKGPEEYNFLRLRQ